MHNVQNNYKRKQCPNEPEVPEPLFVKPVCGRFEKRKVVPVIAESAIQFDVDYSPPNQEWEDQSIETIPEIVLG
jgi:hypothetical protein